MKSLGGILLTIAALMLASCAHQRTALLRISQQETDLNMIQRVKAEAEAECARDDGLRGVTWPYPSIHGNDYGLEYVTSGLAQEINSLKPPGSTPTPRPGVPVFYNYPPATHQTNHNAQVDDWGRAATRGRLNT